MSKSDDATSAEAPVSIRNRVPAVGETEKLSPGQCVGPYEIESEHSRGGFATVYRARHTKLDRPVAIKVLSKFLSSAPEMIKRFENEARAINRIRHPNIVDVTDFGVLSGDRPYFVMEWLEGRDLREELKHGGPMSPERVADAADDIASALTAAHTADIVHRDLKAANVIALSGEGRLRYKLLDFGVAKILESEADAASLFVTDMGVRVGTPHAMAPEQIRCQPVSPATDVYAFGVLLYELLCGHPPFHETKSPQELATRHLRDSPPALSVRNSMAAIGLDRVIARCMAKDPEARYQSADDVARAVRATLGAGPFSGLMPKLALGVGGLIVVAACVTAFMVLRGGDTKESQSKAAPGANVTKGPAQQERDAAGPSRDASAPEDSPPAKAWKPAPKRFDTRAGLDLARDLANTGLGGAKLYRIDIAAPVLSTGHVNLTTRQGAEVAFRFVPAFNNDGACVYTVRFDRSGTRHQAEARANASDCLEQPVRTPACSLFQVVKRLAVKYSLDPKQIVNVRYWQVSGQPTPEWRVNTTAGPARAVPDDCGR